MPTKIYKNQKLLCLITPPDSNLIGEIGEEAQSSGSEAFHLSNSRGDAGYFRIPTAAGFHVWEGETEAFSGDSGPGGNDPQDPDVTWHGEWRPATIEDLRAFGVALPHEGKTGPCRHDVCPCLDPGSIPSHVINCCGPIHQFFELSYASYLVLPRSILQSMPKDWQARFVMALAEIERRFDAFPGEGCYDVLLKDDSGKVMDDPLANYDRGRRIIPSKTA